MARLDLGANDGAGLTLTDVEHKLCQGTDLGDLFGDGGDTVAFGDNQELWVEFTPPDSTATFVQLNPGYVGTLKFKNQHNHYEVALGSPIMKNGQPFLIDWHPDAVFTEAVFSEADEIWTALKATFLDDPTPDPGGCQITGNCVVGVFGTAAFFFFPTLGFGFIANDITAPQPAASTADVIQMFKI